MRKSKNPALVFAKIWRSPLMIATPLAIALLVGLWWAQQSNVNSLTRRIRMLKRQIRELPTEVTSQKRLEQQITSLQQQIDALPPIAPQRDQLNQQIMAVQQQVNTLAPEVFTRNLEQQITSLQQQVNALPLITPQQDLMKQQLAVLKQEVDDLAGMVTKTDRLTLEQNRLALEQDQITLQNAVYGSLIQALGALFFCTTAFLIWRYLKTTEEKQIIERFSQAVEHLGSDKQEVRLGGIYALERIAKDSEKDYWTVMEVLTSFVHLRCPLGRSTAPVLPNFALLAEHLDEWDDTDEQYSRNRDVQAGLRVIGRRDTSKDPEDKRIDLSRTNLAQANLKSVVFRGIDLHEANLTQANLREADLSEAELTGADLKGAYLGLANLKAAQLNQANLSQVELIGGRLRSADLTKADLTNADLRGVDLRKANLDGANLQGVNLKGANLKGVLNLTPEQLKQAFFDQTTELPDSLRSLLPAPPEPSDAHFF
jgi:hypothetical protein